MKKDLSIEEALTQIGKCIFPIKGKSMLPLLESDKDTVLLVPVTKTLEKYDMALYKCGEKYLLHRVIAVKKGYYIICGDNCIAKEKVSFQNVIGVAEGFYKNGKYVSCNNEEYLKYAKKRAKTRLERSVLRNAQYYFKKLFRKK